MYPAISAGQCSHLAVLLLEICVQELFMSLNIAHKNQKLWKVKELCSLPYLLQKQYKNHTCFKREQSKGTFQTQNYITKSLI